MRTLLAAVALTGAATIAVASVALAQDRPPKPGQEAPATTEPPAGGKPMDQAAAEGEGDLLFQITPGLVGEVLAMEGLSWSETTDQSGDPMIEVDVVSGGLPGEQLNIIFYECDQSACEDIALWSWYDTPQPVSLEIINQWNAERRWAKAYLDQDKDAVLEYDINATGGIGRDAFAILLRTYIQQMTGFSEMIGYQQ